MNKTKKILTGLKHEEYEHPFDRKALERLESIPFLTKACQWVTSNFYERIYTIQYTGSNLKVTSKNYPKIYEYLDYACKVLDLDRKPDLYIQWGYGINAFTIGAENPIIVLNSGLIDLCSEDEILFVVAHECGHVKSNHMLYHMMAQGINEIINAMPGGTLFAGGLQYALYYWYRMSEFTADRAGLLCCQNKDAVITSFIKMAGLPINEYNNINASSFIEQAENFKMLDDSNMNKVVKWLSIANNSHPWTVMRAAEILNWIKSGEYNRIV
ncbi:MAG: M48 family metallopeptidase [Bacteroidales bacterium]|nr:M48 family metallopeptidase [Bacteroidales bacterium]